MISYIGPIINLFIGGTVIYYLYYLEKINCKCSLTFQRNYIYYYSISFFFINIINIFFQDKIKKLSIILLPVSIILLIAGIINIVYTIEYVDDMKKQNCECSESIIRDLMFIIAILQICAFIIVFIVLIMSIIAINVLKITPKQISSRLKLRKK